VKLRKLVSMRETFASEGYFARLLSGDSWAGWRVLLIAIVGEELSPSERVVFEGLTGRASEPLEPVAQTLPSGARTKAGELSTPRNASSF